jgi:hypothetical protein
MAILNQSDIELLSQPVSSAPKTWLWPNTPSNGNHQNIIKKRVGASDDALFDPRSRLQKISKTIRKAGGHKQGLSILDIGCGYAVLLKSIKERFPSVQAIGLNPLVGGFDTHESAQAAGFIFVRNWIQSLVKTTLENKINIVPIMNSYRSWESAQLPDLEKNLPNELDKWLAKNADFTIVTLSNEVSKKFKQEHEFYKYLGRGEDDSKMILTRF